VLKRFVIFILIKTNARTLKDLTSSI